jgi:hypothetical protein
MADWAMTGARTWPDAGLGIRASGDGIETAVSVYRRRDGRAVALIAVESIGERTYFETLCGVVLTLHGAGGRVLYQELPAGGSDAALARSLGLRWISSAESGLAGMRSRAASAARNIELVRVSASGECVTDPVVIEVLKRRGERAALERIREMVIQERLAKARRVRAYQSRARPRERVEVARMLEEADDVVAVVSVVHVAVMHSLLLRAGFWLDAMAWYTVLDLRELDPISLD